MLKGDRCEPPFIDEEPENGDIPELALDKPLGIPLSLVDKPAGNIDADIPLLAKGPEVMDDIPPLPAKLLPGAFNLPEVISPGPYIIDLSDKALNAKKVYKKKTNEETHTFNRFFSKIIFFNSCYQVNAHIYVFDNESYIAPPNPKDI